MNYPTLTRVGGQLIITHGDTYLSLPYAQATTHGLCHIRWTALFMHSIGARRVQSDMPRRMLRDALYGPTIARKKVRKAALG